MKKKALFSIALYLFKSKRSHFKCQTIEKWSVLVMRRFINSSKTKATQNHASWLRIVSIPELHSCGPKGNLAAILWFQSTNAANTS